MLRVSLLLVSFGSIGVSVPSSAQGLPPVPVPPGNEMTDAKVRLGATLFWDEQLSSSKTVACGTCHMPEAGGSDPRAWIDPGSARHPGPDGEFGTDDDRLGSIGVPEVAQRGVRYENEFFGTDPQVTDRRPRSVIGAAYMRVAFWDGRAGEVFFDPETGERLLDRGAALESQSIAPLLSAVEMGAHGRRWSHVVRDLIFAEPLGLSPGVPDDLREWIDGRDYSALFEEAFDNDEMSAAQFAMAVGSYQRTLIPSEAPILGGPSALTDLEREGFRVFREKHCAECHATRLGLFSDREFHFVGATDPAVDRGLGLQSGEARHNGLFITPSLLGVELRAPYFHDGSRATLDDVLDFYDEGPQHGRDDQREVVPARFTDRERAALLTFLGRPLTDPRMARAMGPFERPLLSSEAYARTTAPLRGVCGPSGTRLARTAAIVRAEPWRRFAAWLPGRGATMDAGRWTTLVGVPTADWEAREFALEGLSFVEPSLVGARVMTEWRALTPDSSERGDVMVTLETSL